MLRKVIIGLAIASTAAAQTEITPYISLNGGLGFIHDVSATASDTTVGKLSFDGGYVIEGAVGLKLDRDDSNYPIRTELAYSYQKNDMNKYTDSSGILGPPGTTYKADGDTTAMALMLNGYVDIPFDNGLSPYLLVGVGGVYLDLNADNVPIELSKDLVFAGQAGGGLGYHLTETLILDLRYQFIRTAEFKVQDTPASFQASVHRLTAGLRFEF